MTNTFPLLTLLLLLLPAGTASAQEPTQIMIRAVSNDAKIIGSGVGGARIVVQDAVSGDVLAEGLQEGGTGSTERIITAHTERDGVVYDTEGAAAYLAEISIDRPTVVDITAYGPLVGSDFVPRSSKRMLVLPGEHVLGEGVILEVNGFAVELLEADVSDSVVGVTARVTMLCGCPTEPGGLWDADDIRVSAQLLEGDAQVASSTLRFAGETSTFEGELTAPGPGTYAVRVTASEPAEGNFGRAVRQIEIR